MQNNSSNNELFYSQSQENKSEIFIPKKRLDDLQQESSIVEQDAAIDAFVPGFDTKTNDPHLARDVFFPKEKQESSQKKETPAYLKPLIEDIEETNRMCQQALHEGSLSDAQQLYSMLRERLIGIRVHKEDKEIINERMKELFSRIELVSLESEARKLLQS